MNNVDKLTDIITDRQSEISNYIIETIVKRIKSIYRMSKSDAYALQRLYETGSDLRDINKKIAKLTGLQENDISKLIYTAAKESYLTTKPYYEFKGLTFIPFEKNKELQKVVKTVAKVTLLTYKNLSQSTAFAIRNPRTGKLTYTKVSKVYQSIIDQAIQASQSGIVDYHTSMRKAITELADSGLRYVTYHPESGKKYSVKLDTAVRRNILDGIRMVNQGVQDETGKQFGSDGKEITVHQYPAPDHAPIQGHQFTNEEWEKLQSNQPFKDVTGESFAAIERKIGIWNCRHFAYSIIIGVNKPNYTKKELRKIEEENQKGYTTPSGEHLTMYECAQEQRRRERDIRALKEQYVALRDSGDVEGSKSVRAKITQLSKEYKAFSEACGLNTRPNNMRVIGYPKKVG